jgi:putative membrane protein insertion efficiency factor
VVGVQLSEASGRKTYIEYQKNILFALYVLRGELKMKFLVIDILGLYKAAISPLLPAACRFEPTCSEYTRQAVEKYGVLKGTWMGLRRISRCHPLCQGGYDPVK